MRTRRATGAVAVSVMRRTLATAHGRSLAVGRPTARVRSSVAGGRLPELERDALVVEAAGVATRGVDGLVEHRATELAHPGGRRGDVRDADEEGDPGLGGRAVDAAGWRHVL